MTQTVPTIARPTSWSGGGPVLVGANEYGFRPGERLRNDLIGSVCLVWVITGRGVVRTGAAAFDLVQASALWLPWRHPVRWDADARHPFRVGTVHFVPWHRHGVEVVPRSPFGDDPLLDSDDRRGEPGEPILLPAPHPLVEGLAALGGYAIDRFRGDRTDEPALRAIGGLLQSEYERSAATGPATGPQPPITFLRMRDHIDQHLEQRLSVADVARVGDSSASTAERLFTRWAETSISAWVRNRRMDRAAVLLTSSGLRVSEVARAVGFTDALYFSRVFSSVFGVPPSRYASGRIRP